MLEHHEESSHKWSNPLQARACFPCYTSVFSPEMGELAESRTLGASPVAWKQCPWSLGEAGMCTSQISGYYVVWGHLQQFNHKLSLKKKDQT